jgi:hypothetical protein
MMKNLYTILIITILFFGETNKVYGGGKNKDAILAREALIRQWIIDHPKEYKDRIRQDEKRIARARVADERARKAKSWADQKKGREMIKANKARIIKEQAELHNRVVRNLAKQARAVSQRKIEAARADAEKVRKRKIRNLEITARMVKKQQEAIKAKAKAKAARVLAKQRKIKAINALAGVKNLNKWKLDLQKQKGNQEKSAELILDNKAHFTFHKEEMTSAVRIPVISTNISKSTIFDYRPTLFITIPGFKIPNSTADVSWPNNIQKMLISIWSSNGGRYSQYKHFKVDWESMQSMRRQMHELGAVVNNFLDNRAYPWDVVLIGNSRGGILAHELTTLIVDNDKINKLHTFLLDPTASVAQGDKYPVRKVGGAKHYGSLYYDNNSFLLFHFMTLSDRPITGYDNYGRGEEVIDYSHLFFPKNWVKSSSTHHGFARALEDIWDRKQGGSFQFDGSGQVTEVVVITVKNIYVDLDAYLDGSNVGVDGELFVGLGSANVNVIGGTDGVGAQVGLLIVTAQVAINKDVAYVSYQDPAFGFSGTFSDHGLYLNANIGSGLVVSNINANFSGINAGVNTVIGGVKATISLSEVSVGGDILDASGDMGVKMSSDEVKVYVDGVLDVSIDPGKTVKAICFFC